MGVDGRSVNGDVRRHRDEADCWLARISRFWSAHLDALRHYLDKMDHIDTNKDREEEKDD